MKILFVYFTFSKDEELLKCSLKGIDRLRKIYPEDTIDVNLMVDAKYPLSTIPNNVTYTLVDKDRGENLFGLSWVKEEVRILSSVGLQGNYDWVVKIDSDTIVNDLDFLHNAKNVDFVSQRRDKNHNTYGAIMSFNRTALQKMAVMKKEFLMFQMEKLWQADDWFFSFLLNKRIFSAAQILHPTNCYSERINCDLIKKHSCCDFKEVRYIYGNQEEFREKALKRMNIYIDFLNNES